MAKKLYAIQENGQITLPKEWRDRHDLKKGDLVAFEETDGGLLISFEEAKMLKLMDELGDVLREKGLSLEDMIASGREIRQEIYNEKYATQSDD